MRYARISHIPMSGTATNVILHPCPDRVALEIYIPFFILLRCGDVNATNIGAGGGLGFSLLYQNLTGVFYHESRLAAQRWTAALDVSQEDQVISVVEYFEGPSAPRPDAPDAPAAAVTGV